MTGEVFGLFAKSSTSSDFIETSQSSIDGSGAFNQSVIESMRNPERILRSLFSIRATPLLFGTDKQGHMSARLSGLLIGLEIAGMRKKSGDAITLISTGVLAQNYLHAFKIVGIECNWINADTMARTGLDHAARALWPQLFGQKERAQ